jgi:hypothetical protein
MMPVMIRVSGRPGMLAGGMDGTGVVVIMRLA